MPGAFIKALDGSNKLEMPERKVRSVASIEGKGRSLQISGIREKQQRKRQWRRTTVSGGLHSWERQRTTAEVKKKKKNEGQNGEICFKEAKDRKSTITERIVRLRERGIFAGKNCNGRFDSSPERELVEWIRTWAIILQSNHVQEGRKGQPSGRDRGMLGGRNRSSYGLVGAGYS